MGRVVIRISEGGPGTGGGSIFRRGAYRRIKYGGKGDLVRRQVGQLSASPNPHNMSSLFWQVAT